MMKPRLLIFVVGLMVVAVVGFVVLQGMSKQPITAGNAAQVAEIVVLESQSGEVGKIRISPDGKLLAATKDDGIHLWSMTHYSEVGLIEIPANSLSAIVFSLDGTQLIGMTQNWTQDAGFKKIRVWDVATRQETAALTNYGSSGSEDARPAHTFALSPDGTRIAVDTCGGRVTLSSSGGLQCASNGVLLVDSTTGDFSATFPQNLKGNVWGIAFSPDGNMLAASAADGTLRLFDVKNSLEISTVVQLDYRIFDVAFSYDGSLLASGAGDGSIILVNLATPEKPQVWQGHNDTVVSVAFSPDGSVLATGSADNSISLWNVATQEKITTLQGHQDLVSSVAFSPDGITLASGSYDGTVRLWSQRK